MVESAPRRYLRLAMVGLVTLLAVCSCAATVAETESSDIHPTPGTVEVLERDGAGRPVLARVALEHALPHYAEERIALGGTWSYLIRDGDRVAIFDVGPRYALAWCLVPWFALKANQPRLPNNQHIWRALEATYPGMPISTIVFSHWHADHTEDAPALQQEARARFGVTPPMRIMAEDRHARWQGLLPNGADNVFTAAGFAPGSWVWGEDLQDLAPIGQTGYRVLAMPGHTRGTVALINSDSRISLGPPGYYRTPRTTFWTEVRERYPETILRFYHATYGFRHYSTHPGKELLEYWPTDTPDPKKVRVSGYLR